MTRRPFSAFSRRAEAKRSLPRHSLRREKANAAGMTVKSESHPRIDYIPAFALLTCNNQHQARNQAPTNRLGFAKPTLHSTHSIADGRFRRRKFHLKADNK